MGKFGRVIIKTVHEGGTLLNTKTWSEISELEQMIENITVEHENVGYKYKDICARWNGRCRLVGNQILSQCQGYKFSKYFILEYLDYFQFSFLSYPMDETQNS